MRFKIVTLGCRMNQAESDRLVGFLGKYGFIEDEDIPEIVFVNTCAVTKNAERKARQKINLLKNKYPLAEIWAFGCGVRWDKENLNGERVRLFRNINEVKKEVGSNFEVKNSEQKIYSKHVRKEVLIQRGCENFCTFCAVVHLRGRSKNYSSKKIIQEIRRCEKAGFPEVVLTGTNIGAYGCDKTTMPTGTRLAELIEEIIKNTENIKIRLSSMGPQYLTDELINLFKNKRLASYLHVSLQSGSDKVLEKMNRPYRTKEVKEILKKVKKSCGNVLLSADVIVGFPGEGEEEYRKTCDFVKEVGFAKLHVFPYSERKGTPAESFEEKVAVNVRKERAKKLRKIGDKIREKYIKSFVGKEVEAIFEQEKNGYYIGNTDNFLPIRVKSEENLVGKNIFVKIIGIKEGWLEGEFK